MKCRCGRVGVVAVIHETGEWRACGACAVKLAAAVSAARERQHHGQRSNYVLANDSCYRGFMGELCFGRAFDLTVDFRDKRGQTDGGIDFTLASGLRVDVKVDTVVAGREPAILLHAERGTPADVLVLVTLTQEATSPAIAGWVWAWEVLSQEPVTTKKGTTVHIYRGPFKAVEALRQAERPAEMLDRIEPGVTWNDLEEAGRRAFGLSYENGVVSG